MTKAKRRFAPVEGVKGGNTMPKSKKFYPPISITCSEEFDRLIIVDPHLRRRFNDDKIGILDLCLYLKSRLCIDVEIQN
ncbi:MAG: hypothetical protein LBG07_05420 [Treponema sp.]|nr:hypothetical protein [Treponema sp.]